MRKKGFILLILVSGLWWWYFYRTRTSSGKTEILKFPSDIRQTDAKAIDKKERALEAELIRKAEKAFTLEYGRKPENLTELVEKGFLSPGIYHSPPE